MKFTACKFLDFSNNYVAKKQILGSGKVFWLRDISYDLSMPAMVQFCSKRGRINDPEGCTCEARAYCPDYVEFEHDVPDAEINA